MLFRSPQFDTVSEVLLSRLAGVVRAESFEPCGEGLIVVDSQQPGCVCFDALRLTHRALQELAMDRVEVLVEIETRLQCDGG